MIWRVARVRAPSTKIRIGTRTSTRTKWKRNQLIKDQYEICGNNVDGEEKKKRVGVAEHFIQVRWENEQIKWSCDGNSCAKQQATSSIVEKSQEEKKHLCNNEVCYGIIEKYVWVRCEKQSFSYMSEMQSQLRTKMEWWK